METRTPKQVLGRRGPVETPPAFIQFGWGTGLAVRHDRSLAFAAPNRAWQGCARARD